MLLYWDYKFMTGLLLVFFFPPVMAQEDGVGLLTAIKGTSKYRRSKRIDFVSDYLPPSTSEFKSFFEEAYG